MVFIKYVFNTPMENSLKGDFEKSFDLPHPLPAPPENV